MRGKGFGRLWIIAAAILWGTTGTAQSFAPPGATPPSVGASRILIGGLALLVVAGLQGQLSRHAACWPRLPLLLAALGVAAYQLCFFAGVVRAGVALGTVVALGSAPILTGMVTKLRGEPWEPGWPIATFLALLGLACILLPGRANHVDLLGVMLCAGAGAAYAMFTVASRQALLAGTPETGTMAIAFTGGAALLLPLLLLRPHDWLANPRGLAVALHLGLIATALAYICFSRGLRVTPASTATTLSLAEPLTATTLGIVVLGERPPLMAAVGMLLLLSGLVWLAITPRWRRDARLSIPPPPAGNAG